MANRRAVGMAVAVAAAVGLLAIMLAWLAPRDGSLRQVLAAGQLRVGYAVEPPYAYVGAAGQADGESPSLARAVAARLGVAPVFVLMDFAALIPALESGRIDMVAAGLFITPERAQRVSFSRPTLRVRAGWLQRAAAPALPADAAALAAMPAIRVAVIDGAVEAQWLRASGLPADRILPMPDAATAMAAVSGGQADVLALSWPSVSAMAARSDGVLLARPAVRADAEVSLVGLALRRGDERLRAAVDAALAAHLGSGEHRAALAAVGLGREDLPPGTPDAGH